MELRHVSVAQSWWLRSANSSAGKVVTLIMSGLQSFRRLHVGLNNTSTGLRLAAWPTAGIILTTTEEQEEERVRTPELSKSYGAPCGWEVTLRANSQLLKNREFDTIELAKMKSWKPLKCFLADSASWPHILTCRSLRYRVPGQGWWRAATQGSGCSWSPRSCGRWWTWRHARDIELIYVTSTWPVVKI